MVVAIGMTAEAARSLGSLLTVFGVTAVAVGVLRNGVKPSQALGLVTAAAARRARDASGPMWPVTIVAFFRQLAVW